MTTPTLESFLAAVEDVDAANDESLRTWIDLHGVATFLDNAQPPLYAATVLGNEMAVKILLDAKADIGACFDQGNSTALHIACQFGYEEIVDVLLSSPLMNADALNATSSDYVCAVGQLVKITCGGGRTALHYAAEGGHVSICKKLIAAGADLHTKDRDATSALDLAMEHCIMAKTDKARLLFRNTAEVLLLGQPFSLDLSHEDVLDHRMLRERAIRTRISTELEEKERQQKEQHRVKMQQRHVHKHPEVCNRAKWDSNVFVLPEFARAEHVLPTHSCVQQVIPGVFAFPLFSVEFCNKIVDEVEHFERSAKELDLPLFYRHDGNIGCLQDCGFQGLLEALTEAVVQPMVTAAFPTIGPIEVYHAFVTRNNVERKEKFKLHQDKSLLTLNICIRRTEDLRGSTVTFFKERDDGPPHEDEDAVYEYEHGIGYAVLHEGKQWHRTNPLLQGERYSLIVWAREKAEQKDTE